MEVNIAKPQEEEVDEGEKFEEEHLKEQTNESSEESIEESSGAN